MKHKYSKNELEIIVMKSRSIGEVMEKLGKVARGSNYSLYKKLIVEEYQIDISHFRKKGELSAWNKFTKEQFIKTVLVYNGPNWTSFKIKKRLLQFEILDNLCNECGQKPIWNNKSLVLQLDHINGNHRDNRLENLRILCPNCHTQTETFCRI